MSRLDEIARLLRDSAPVANASIFEAADAADGPARGTDTPRAVYAGEPVAFEDDRLIFDDFPKVTTCLDFKPDPYGYLVNSEGLVMMGRSDCGPDSGGGLRLTPIRMEDGPGMPARATTAIRYKANLPKDPLKRRANASDQPELLASQQTPALTHGTLPGGEVRVFDSHGRAATIRLRWRKTHSAEAGHYDGWQLFYHVQDSPLVLRAGLKGWHAAGDVLYFDPRGRLAEAAPITLSLGCNLEPVELDLGHGDLTQFPDSTGLVKVLTCTQNGWPPASLREIAVRSDGRVLGGFDNGRVELLGVAAFAPNSGSDRLQQAA